MIDTAESCVIVTHAANIPRYLVDHWAVHDNEVGTARDPDEVVGLVDASKIPLPRCQAKPSLQSPTNVSGMWPVAVQEWLVFTVRRRSKRQNMQLVYQSR
jgi:hypothetical protein